MLFLSVAKEQKERNLKIGNKSFTEKIKKYIGSFIPVLLAVFMLIIMGPTEIFFGNYTELGFVFFDFGHWLDLAGLFAAVLLAGIIMSLGSKIVSILGWVGVIVIVLVIASIA